MPMPVGRGRNSRRWVTRWNRSIAPNDKRGAVENSRGRFYRRRKYLSPFEGALRSRLVRHHSPARKRRHALHGLQRRLECRRSDHQDDERHADRAAAILRLVRPRRPSRSIRIIWTPIRTPPTWARPARNVSCNSWKRTKPLVIALREGAWLRIEKGSCELKGETGGRLFRRKLPPLELQPGSLDRFLM